jgi:hypothetical protein
LHSAVVLALWNSISPVQKKARSTGSGLLP